MRTPDPLEKILALSQLNLSPELVREVLEHDKWRVREQHRHEREMAVLRGEAVTGQTTTDLVEFNAETSYGQATESHVGLVAKSKVAAGAALRAKDLDNPDNLPLPLLSLFLTISWCGERLSKWPKAKDAKTAMSLRDDLAKAVEKYGIVKTMKAVELVSGHLDTRWDDRLVTEQLSELREKYEEVKTSSISSSPLFAEFHKAYPHIDGELFDKCYDQNGQNFTASAIYLLRREFKFNPPPELPQDGFEVRWQQYLPTYLGQWQKEIKSMETRMRVAQKAWKESMS
jgi:hypothetical protein